MNRAFIAAIAFVVVGCTSLGSSTTTPTPPTRVRRVVPFTRSCNSAVFGQPNTRDALRIGPLRLIGTGQPLARSTFEERHGRYPAIKVLAVVAGRNDVTVTVPLTQRDSLFLLYNPAAPRNRWGFRVAEADAQVRFKACPGADPQYDGGFLSSGARCVELEVESASSGLRTASFPLGGRASC